MTNGLPVMEEAYSNLKSRLKSKVKKDELLAGHTTLNVGGPASIYVIADTFDDLKLVIETARTFNLRYFVVGKGSNLLISDKGFKGIVVKLGPSFSRIQVCDDLVFAGAAVSLSVLIRETIKKGFNDLVFMTGIPGSLGGALNSNAGAQGKAIGDLIEEVKLFTFEGIKNIPKEKIRFGYRESSLFGQGIILEAVLRLHDRSESEQAKREMRGYLEKRRRTQPLSLPNAGSVFKNPGSSGDKGESCSTSAGRLIEEVGCKGLRVGGAEISSVHANFIVNSGDASAQDVYTLLKIVQEKVYKAKKIHLEPEIILVGDFD